MAPARPTVGAADVAVPGLAARRGTLAGASAGSLHDIAAVFGVVGLGILCPARRLVPSVHALRSSQQHDGRLEGWMTAARGEVLVLVVVLT